MVVTLAKLVKGRERFLISVYAILVAQLVLTFVMARSFQSNPKFVTATKRYGLLLAVASIGVVLIMSLRLPQWVKLVLFTVLSSIMAMFLTAMTSRVSPNIINQALISTIAIFVSLSLFALGVSSLGINLGWMGVYLFAALIGLIVVSLVFLLVEKPTHVQQSHKIIVAIGMVLFSMFVVYDTNMVLQREYVGTPIDAAEEFYLTFINLFTRTLTIQSS